jgi:hypothetical protein
MIRRNSCHEPSCRRIGNHQAAGSQFLLCYRHHPDHDGKRPTAEMIRRLHRDHVRRQRYVQRQIDSGHNLGNIGPAAAGQLRPHRLPRAQRHRGAFNGFKHWRGLTTRYDNTPAFTVAGLVLGAALIWAAD